jgi:hypothetical protein
MTIAQDSDKAETESKEPSEAKHEGDAGEGEFKLTVRKLELPVRPRGVLAE